LGRINRKNKKQKSERMRVPLEDEAAEQVSVNLVREGFGLKEGERRLKQLDC